MIAQGQWLLPEWELTDTKMFEQAKAKQVGPSLERQAVSESLAKRLTVMVDRL